MGIRVCLDSPTCRGPSTTVGGPAYSLFDKKRGVRNGSTGASNSQQKYRVRVLRYMPLDGLYATNMWFGARIVGIMPSVRGASARESYASG